MDQNLIDMLIMCEILDEMLSNKPNNVQKRLCLIENRRMEKYEYQYQIRFKNQYLNDE